MWAVFVAVFGGLFWAFKIGKDVSASNQADKKIKQIRMAEGHWYEQVKDIDLEIRIREEPAFF